MKMIILLSILCCFIGCNGGPMEGYKIENAKRTMECMDKGGIPMHDAITDEYAYCAYKEAK